ncbi:MAG TPA: hypothetical protein VGN69_05125 [Solirubrobacteraceae bacterium]|jgi:hypothetical protein|nr:hypothetical protein [Solirubrobacteraceae bacterium]
MYAVLVKVDLSGADPVEGPKHLRENVVPMVKQAPGFQYGTWLSPQDGKGMSLVVFDSEENAKAAAQMAQPGSNPGPGVTVEHCHVREVVASA